MSSRSRSARPTFFDRSRGERRDRFVSLRWTINQDPNGRGVFTSHHLMDGGLYEGERYAGPGSQWNDFRFLSRAHARAGLVYSATVRTLRMTMFQAAEQYAWEEEERLLTPEEFALAHPPLRFIPCGRGQVELADDPDAVFERHGGLSAWGIRAHALRQAPAHLEALSPSCRLDRAYRSGLGAIFIADLPEITIDNLAGLVRDFWDRGETAYQGAPIASDDPSVGPWLAQAIENTAQGWERMDQCARGLLSTE